MAQKEPHTDRSEKSLLSNPMPIEFAEIGKQRIDEFVKMQAELLDKLQETNRQWMERAQSEVNLASEFASRLVASRSIPDAMIAYQEWTSRRFEIMAEDGKRFLANTQKLMETGTRLMSNAGWPATHGGLST